MRRIADIDIVPAELPTWHDSVRAYRVTRRGGDLGVFYLDLFARQGKQGGSWVDAWRLAIAMSLL